MDRATTGRPFRLFARPDRRTPPSVAALPLPRPRASLASAAARRPASLASATSLPASLVGAAALAWTAAACGPADAPRDAHGAIVQELRPTEVDRQPLFRFDAGDVVETHDGPAGLVRVHFTRAGTHAVPAVDDDADGVPDYVPLVAATWEEALAFYGAEGFRAPLGDGALAGEHGGDGRFDVYLLDFAHASDGSFVVDACPPPGSRCIGYAVQENDFAGYGYPSRRVATRILASHEGFHAIQAAYDEGQGVVFSEGTAVWATELFDPALSDFEGFIGGYLEDPSRSIDVPPPGPVPPFAYGSALFFRFLEERFDRGLVRALIEHTEDGAGLPGGADDPADPHWLSQLDRLLAAEYGTGFADAFTDFARWNLFTAGAADPPRSYDLGARYPAVSIEAATLPLAIDRLRVFHASAQYREVPADGRGTVAAELVSLPGTDGADLEDLSLFLAVRRTDGTIARLVEVDGASAEVQLEAGESSVVIAVVNGAYAGESRRPGLCAGSPDEVRACRDLLAPEEPGPDGGSGGGDEGGCGTTGGAPAGAIPAALVALVAWRRRSRRS